MFSGTWSVQVVDEHGHGIAGAEVTYQGEQLSGTDTRYTDDDGWVTFQMNESLLPGPPFTVREVWIDGENVVDAPLRPKDGDKFSFVFP
jgi:hypothetical protein